MHEIVFLHRGEGRYLAPHPMTTDLWEIPEAVAIWAPSSSGRLDYARVLADFHTTGPVEIEWSLELLDAAGEVLATAPPERQTFDRAVKWHSTKLELVLEHGTPTPAAMRLRLSEVGAQAA